MGSFLVLGCSLGSAESHVLRLSSSPSPSRRCRAPVITLVSLLTLGTLCTIGFPLFPLMFLIEFPLSWSRHDSCFRRFKYLLSVLNFPHFFRKVYSCAVHAWDKGMNPIHHKEDFMFLWCILIHRETDSEQRLCEVPINSCIPGSVLSQGCSSS